MGKILSVYEILSNTNKHRLLCVFLFCFVSGLFICSDFLGLYLQHMEVPRLVVKSELQLQAYAIDTATSDLCEARD